MLSWAKHFSFRSWKLVIISLIQRSKNTLSFILCIADHAFFQALFTLQNAAAVFPACSFQRLGHTPTEVLPDSRAEQPGACLLAEPACAHPSAWSPPVSPPRPSEPTAAAPPIVLGIAAWFMLRILPSGGLQQCQAEGASGTSPQKEPRALSL